MNEYIADTMALILRLEKRKMPKNVKDKFVQAEKGQCQITIPSIVFAELGYLSEKNRIDTNLEEAKNYLEKNPQVKQNPLTFETIVKAFEIDDVPELHDRLIAASAKGLNIPILSNDPAIQSSKYVKCIWKN